MNETLENNQTPQEIEEVAHESTIQPESGYNEGHTDTNTDPESRTGHAKSWKELRQKAEQAQKERDEAYRLLQEIQQTQQSSGMSVSDPQTDSDITLKDDELVEGKHLSSFQKKIKRIEQDLKKYQQISYESAIETRLKNELPDFGSVVNEDNIAHLKEQYPELATTLHSTSDLYAKAKSTYMLIKKLGIAPDDTYQQERALAKNNSNKPRSSISIAPQQGESPLQRANAFANGLTDELRSQLRKEMEEARKRL